MSGFFERLTRKRPIASAPAPAATRTTRPAKGYDALSTEQVMARMGDVSQSDLSGSPSTSVSTRIAPRSWSASPRFRATSRGPATTP